MKHKTGFDALNEHIRQQGFDPLSAPYTPWHPAWEKFPICKAVRIAERETGFKYINSLTSGYTTQDERNS